MTRALVLTLALATQAACRAGTPNSPEELRDRYVDALRREDADGLYDLLTPEVQATVSRSEFKQRFAALERERRAALADVAALPRSARAPAFSGTTDAGAGRRIHWTQVDESYYVVGGLPQLPDTSTPASTVRSLLAAIRELDLGAMTLVMSDTATARLRADWQARATAIEQALDRPGALVLSPDLHRAELRYDEHRAVVLEQTSAGWRISALE